MKHETASEKLLELAYGELPPREARAVEAHAAGCDACGPALARIRETRALMAQLPSEPAPERGEVIVLAAAREAADARRRRPLRILPAWLWGGGLGAVAVAAIAVVSWQLAKSPPQSALRSGGSELMGTAPAAPPPAPAPARGLVEDKAVAEVAAPPEKRAAAQVVAKSKETRGQLSDAYDAAAPSREEAEPFAKAEAPAPAPARARAAERKAAPAAATMDREVAQGVERRSFADCPGERRRIVERDSAGRVVRYVRVGEHVTVEQLYGADGRLVSAVVIEGGQRHALPLDTPGLVQNARDAGIDAPPRCSP